MCITGREFLVLITVDGYSQILCFDWRSYAAAQGMRVSSYGSLTSLLHRDSKRQHHTPRGILCGRFGHHSDRVCYGASSL
jgi:hypothetical protein